MPIQYLVYFVCSPYEEIPFRKYELMGLGSRSRYPNTGALVSKSVLNVCRKVMWLTKQSRWINKWIDCRSRSHRRREQTACQISSSARANVESLHFRFS